MESNVEEGRLQEVIRTAGDAHLDGLEDVVLGEDGSLAVADGARLQVFADAANIDQATLEQLMRDDEIPGRTRGEQTLAILGVSDAVGEGLVVVAGEDTRGEIGGTVAHGTCRHGLWGVRAGVAVTTRRRRLENLILCGHLLEVALQSLVLERGLLLGCLEVGELGFQILDVLLFALTESSLCCTVLSLALRLGGSQVVLLGAPAAIAVVIALDLCVGDDVARQVADATEGAIATVAKGRVVGALRRGCRGAAVGYEAILLVLGVEALGKVEAME